MIGAAIDGAGATLRIRGKVMASGNDMKAHGATYDAFIGMLKWAVPIVAVVAFVVVLIIS
jgi:hypothetical protein